MAIELPAAPRVYTTTYDNFKGVDFTNDSTNVWRRRSPTGVNMLPDASGRPFKRHGWDILLSQTDLRTALGVDSCTITKCAYFELAGQDHIVVFTDRGVIFYNGEITAVNSTDPACYGSYDRCFFFEGDGTSAFYIYGDYRMWRYGADFTLEEITEQLYIPNVIAGATADGTGTLIEPYNLLYNMASVLYHDNELFACWGTEKLVFEVDKETFNTAHPKNYVQKFTCTDGENNTWEDQSETTVNLASIGITPINQKTGDEIFVANVYGLLLPNNIDINTQVIEDLLVRVTVSIAQPLDYQIPDDKIKTTLPSASGEVCVLADTVERDNQQAMIVFYESDFTSTPPVYKTGTDFEEKDAFEVIFPSTQISVIKYSEDEEPSTALTDTGKATLVGGGD